jgi:hypothetical protein
MRRGTGDESWSWVQRSAETFPEVSRKVHYEPDMQTCVLPVKLKAGKTYVIWINAERFSNFSQCRGEFGRPLPAGLPDPRALSPRDHGRRPGGSQTSPQARQPRLALGRVPSFRPRGTALTAGGPAVVPRRGSLAFALRGTRPPRSQAGAGMRAVLGHGPTHPGTPRPGGTRSGSGSGS